MMNFIFLNKEESSNFIQTKDAYYDQMTNEDSLNIFDKSKEDYFNDLVKVTLDWNEEEIEKLRKKISKVEKKLEKFESFFDDILLIKTSGDESFGLPYTRLNAIFIVNGRISESLLIHEMYHILSRKYSFIKHDLYNYLGFEKNEDFKFSDHVSDRIINPDALEEGYFVRFNDLNIFPYISKNMGHFVDFNDTVYQDKEKFYNGKMLINRWQTSYTSHPEEICAEYFSYFFTKREIHGDIVSFMNKLKELLTY